MSSFVELKCLDRHNDDCAGAIEYRHPLSGTGIPYARCDKHWTQRLAIQEGINRRYPQMQPADFDPGYAGESWEEEL